MELLLNNIYPIIKVVSSQQVGSDEKMPKIMLGGDDTPITKKLSADLMIFYGNESDNAYEILNRNHLRSIGINEEELHKIALKNYISNLTNDISIQFIGLSGMVNKGPGLLPTLLLHNKFWGDLERMVEGELVVVVPSRFTIFFSDSEDKNAMAEIKNIVRNLNGDDDKTFLLSTWFLKWNGNGWDNYERIDIS